MELPKEIIERSICRGAILHSYRFEGIDHGKFFVVIGVDKDSIVGFFFINSNIHPMLENILEHFNLQYPLRKSDYSFLRYDSFLDAHQLKKISIVNITESIRKGNTTYIGNLTEDDTKNVMNMCRNSNVFTPREKERYMS